MRLELVGGRRADTDPTVAPLSDVNNFVMLPDGSGMRVRDGFMYTAQYAIRTDPIGRVALMVETAPWNVPISYRHMALQTAGGAPYVAEGEHIRDRSQAISESAIPSVYFPFSGIEFIVVFEPLVLTFTVQRSEPLDASSTVKFRCIDGTAQAGVHYTAPVSDTLSFAAGATSAESGEFTFMGAAVGKYFFIEIYDPDNAKVSLYGTVVANIREDV